MHNIKKLISAIASGDVSAIQNLRESKESGLLSVNDFEPAFKFLVDRGEDGIRNKFDQWYLCSPVPKLNDLAHTMDALNLYLETGSFERVDNVALHNICACAHLIETMQKDNTLHKLDAYRN